MYAGVYRTLEDLREANVTIIPTQQRVARTDGGENITNIAVELGKVEPVDRRKNLRQEAIDSFFAIKSRRNLEKAKKKFETPPAQAGKKPSDRSWIREFHSGDWQAVDQGLGKGGVLGTPLLWWLTLFCRSRKRQGQPRNVDHG
jgi:hypothetical protein